MKSMIAVLAVAVLLFSPGLATADDKDDVIAAMLDYISGWNDGDAAKIAQHLLPDATAFAQGGSGTGLAMAPFNQAQLQNNMDGGANFNFSYVNMNVQVYGDAAVFTAYETGDMSFPNGQVSQGPWRYTAVLIKRDGVWKQAHRHASPLRTGEPGQ
ncbi:MAG: YybH family protein [Vicinamibacterales bacterium]